jgi:hypothetical protein
MLSYSERRPLFIIILIVIKLNAIKLNVVGPPDPIHDLKMAEKDYLKPFSFSRATSKRTEFKTSLESLKA